MRQDAARNRRAILLATEQLLSRHRPDEVTIEQVAVAAGVGKGTVFHRFGSRMGLMLALMQERALGLEEAVRTAEPPLGPGAPSRERLLAFLTAVVEVVGRNKGLIAALGHEVASMPKPHDGPAREHPIYEMWHGHVCALLAEERPDLDADLIADVLLASLHSEPVLHLLERGETDRLTAALHVLALGALNS
ncbi:TetR/AcrR family transcriptional regulator [Actinophytocola oryzae]|uniref:TetR family transcriptional regulator n=1 Tax=Actinophytocola oryzae TaxID=502181 RepID=A0A4R7URJ7_9PSEU|nr:TetR/AcrR family transcriptional regulator [Actinophytocola oryzae]TDV36090.1 TetR family transcriptional regulator [Actinophytocola oryzae]